MIVVLESIYIYLKIKKRKCQLKVLLKREHFICFERFF